MKKFLLALILFFSFDVFSQTAEEYFQRAYDKDQNGDYYGAISDLNKAIELNPNDALAYNNRGVAKALLGNLSEACQDARKAQQLSYEAASELIKMVCN